MIDLEIAEDNAIKLTSRFQRRYKLTHRDLAFMLLELGIDNYLKDMATRQLNGNKVPYLADFHLRQGIKYYQQDLVRQP